ncbi:hypothetical protein [Candidatus Poriferisodalis sp.]|uniref:hypothetical protein n=1 Tax=Candidatus Poriferisodalis sp. TaxID=3101277 RepID=UPI003B022BD3
MNFRWIVLSGLVYWLAACAYMLLVHGEELDLDAVFPFTGQEKQEIGVITPTGPTSSNPPALVTATFWAMGVVIAFPIAFVGKATAVALRMSIIAIGACLLISILRLGILLTPVLALQLLACYRFDMAQHS